MSRREIFADYITAKNSTHNLWHVWPSDGYGRRVSHWVYSDAHSSCRGRAIMWNMKPEARRTCG